MFAVNITVWYLSDAAAECLSKVTSADMTEAKISQRNVLPPELANHSMANKYEYLDYDEELGEFVDFTILILSNNLSTFSYQRFNIIEAVASPVGV